MDVNHAMLKRGTRACADSEGPDMRAVWSGLSLSAYRIIDDEIFFYNEFYICCTSQMQFFHSKIVCDSLMYKRILLQMCMHIVFYRAQTANHNYCRLLCHLVVILKVIFANSVDPDQTAPLPLGAVWSGSTLFACMQK